jgi:hypothetical protein
MSNYVRTPPVLNKSFTSGTFFTQGIPNNTDLDNDKHFFTSLFTSNIGTSNSVFVHQKPLVEITPAQLSSGSLTSNSMIPSSNYNVIKVDIKNKGEKDDPTYTSNILLNIHYSLTPNLGDATTKYSTIIQGGTNFYRNYPIENQYFGVSIKNLDPANEAIFEGKVTLSKYTQYSVPSQIKDPINRFSLSNVVRDGNNFTDDVLLNRVEDVFQTARIGTCDNILATRQTLWNNGTAFNFTSNTSTDVVVKSFSPSDTGLVSISGKDEFDQKKEDIITLAGTSNVFAINSYKVIDNILCLGDFNNEGKVIVSRLTNGEVMNVMDPEAGRSTSLIYVVPDDTNAVVRTLNINGRSSLNTKTKFKLYKVVNNLRNVLVYQNDIRDDMININIPIEIKLVAGETIYAELTSLNIGGVLGDSVYDAKLNIFEYNDSNSSIL